jgi:ATP-dependent DNA ligase
MVTVRPDGFVEPCIPILAAKPPSGRWVHEIKHDGYRLIVRGARPLVRLSLGAASTGPTGIPL